MRAIKFRGKRKFNRKWEYGFYFYNKRKNEYYIIAPENELFATGILNYEIKHIFEIIPETLGQFTGLYDKDGNEIYEGDIVANFYGDSDLIFDKDVVKFGTQIIGDDEFDGFVIHGFYIDNEGLYWDLVHGKVKVIGNIYDNPDLLE